MAEPAADYHRGDMEIEEQAATFHAFIGLTKWGSLVIAVLVLLLTLIFCAHAGLFQALLAALVVAVVGGFMLRSKPEGAHGH